MSIKPLSVPGPKGFTRQLSRSLAAAQLILTCEYSGKGQDLIHVIQKTRNDTRASVQPGSYLGARGILMPRSSRESDIGQYLVQECVVVLQDIPFCLVLDHQGASKNCTVDSDGAFRASPRYGRGFLAPWKYGHPVNCHGKVVRKNRLATPLQCHVSAQRLTCKLRSGQSCSHQQQVFAM